MDDNAIEHIRKATIIAKIVALFLYGFIFFVGLCATFAFVYLDEVWWGVATFILTYFALVHISTKHG